MNVGLVLGGGGARGFAHIGVLRAMEERGISPVAIAGCSIGGIVGAMVANGMSSRRIHDAFQGLDVIKLLDWSSMGGLIGGKGVAQEMRHHVPDTFDKLQIPLRVVAVDVQEGRLVTLFSGELIPALRASSALPGVFSPVEIDGRWLVDGGVLSNTPVDEMRSMTHEPVLVVDVTAPANRKLPFEDSRSFWDRLKEPFKPGHRPLIVELLMKTYDIPVAMLNEFRIVASRPDILVRPQLDPGLKVEDFKRIDEAVDAGYRAANDALDANELTRDI